jgi:hypothetical protein
LTSLTKNILKLIIEMIVMNIIINIINILNTGIIHKLYKESCIAQLLLATTLFIIIEPDKMNVIAKKLINIDTNKRLFLHTLTKKLK